MIPLFSLGLHEACIQELTCLDGKTLIDVTCNHDVLKAEASTAFTCIRPHEHDTHSASELGTLEDGDGTGGGSRGASTDCDFELGPPGIGGGCRRDPGATVDDHTLKKLCWIRLFHTAVLPGVRGLKVID